jgi:hypothetical protein
MEVGSGIHAVVNEYETARAADKFIELRNGFPASIH